MMTSLMVVFCLAATAYVIRERSWFAAQTLVQSVALLCVFVYIEAPSAARVIPVGRQFWVIAFMTLVGSSVSMSIYRWRRESIKKGRETSAESSRVSQ